MVLDTCLLEGLISRMWYHQVSKEPDRDTCKSINYNNIKVYLLARRLRAALPWMQKKKLPDICDPTCDFWSKCSNDVTK